jgi:hypothetical protein
MYLLTGNIIPRMRGCRLCDIGINDRAFLLVEINDVDGEAVDADILISAIAREVEDCPAIGGGAGLEERWGAEREGEKG